MGSDRLIYFRTDGNSRIASGHLMRCFSIALACLRLHMKVCFLISDEESESLLTGILSACEQTPLPDPSLNPSLPDSRLSIIRLKTAAFDCLEKELPEVLSLLGSLADSSAVYFLDSYYVTESYLSSLRPLVKIAYLDDLRLFDYPVDLLINYDVIPDGAMPACKSSYQKAKRLLLGPSYTPLRVSFQDKKAPLREQVSHILITTGASDPCHFCLKIVSKIFGAVLPFGTDSPPLKNTDLADLKVWQSLTLHIVIGKFNTDKELLFQLAKKLPCLVLHENVSDMAALMQTCDLAISAAGTTLYELCALGIPAVSFTIADNQLSSARTFQETGLIPCAGDMRDKPEAVLQVAMDFVTEMSYIPDHCLTDKSVPLCPSYAKRLSILTRMRRLIDGKGAHRIALALRET